jgi:hypothetical protein
MGKNLERRNLPRVAPGIAALLLLNSLLLNSAFAAPPLDRQSFRVPPQGLAQHLDLRPPSHPAESAGSPAEKSHPLAAPMSRQNLSSQDQERIPLRLQEQVSALTSDGMRTRPALQDFVRGVHREGLPIARLFESKSALVHLGLSPRGKPGLWLVQKTH